MLDVSDIERFPVQGGVVAWSLGGASLAIRTERALIYLDLFTGPSPIPELKKNIPEVIEPEAIRWADLTLSTHNDEDHCDRHSLSILHRNTSCLFVGPASCNRLYQEWGFARARTHQIASSESLRFEDMEILACASKDAFDPLAVSYVIRSAGVTIYDGGDTLYLPEMAVLGQQMDLDVAFLSYAKNPPGQTYYMDEASILRAAANLRPRRLILMHYDLWEGLTIDPGPLVDKLEQAGFRAGLLAAGERIELLGPTRGGHEAEG